MQAAICTSDFDGLSGETYIPVEFLYCDSSQQSQQSHSQDAISIVELGKQLLQSAGEGDTEVVRDLMCRGAPFTTDHYGTSALHCAAQNNHLETAEVLLRAGISRDAKTKVDRTPLHLAAYEGHHQMAQLLLSYGAEVDSKDMLKMTPLHWAVEQEHVEVMLILLEHGADTNATSKFDKTPISLALEHDRLDLVDLLQQERKLMNTRELQSQPRLAQNREITEASSGLMPVENTRQEQKQHFETPPAPILQPNRKNYIQYPPSKKTKPVCQQLDIHGPSDDEQEKDTELAERINTIEKSTLKKHKDIGGFDNLEQPLRLLQAHGITMIPVDNDASIVENAMESGRTVVLTEAGKLALNLTRQGPMGVKRIQVGSRKGVPRKVIAIRADKLLGQSPPTLASRGPNILKRNSSAAENKSRKLYFASLSNNTVTNNPRPTVISTQKKVVTPVPEQKVPDLLHLANDIEEIQEDDSSEGNSEPVMDIATLNKQLIEARRLAAEYRKQLQIKEEEAEIYKQQLKNIVAQKSAK